MLAQAVMLVKSRPFSIRWVVWQPTWKKMLRFFTKLCVGFITYNSDESDRKLSGWNAVNTKEARNSVWVVVTLVRGTIIAEPNVIVDSFNQL